MTEMSCPEIGGKKRLNCGSKWEHKFPTCQIWLEPQLQGLRNTPHPLQQPLVLQPNFIPPCPILMNTLTKKRLNLGLQNRQWPSTLRLIKATHPCLLPYHSLDF